MQKNSQFNCAIGLELSEQIIRCVLLREDGELCATQTLPTASTKTDILAQLQQLINDSLRQAEEAFSPVVGIGLGVPGLVEQGVVIDAIEHIPALLSVDLKSELQSTFHYPIYVENDGHMMAIAENCYGASTDYSDVVFITIGAGVGGALKLNGELTGIGDNRGGELGHMIVEVNGLICSCGNAGCIQAYASESGFIHYYRQQKNHNASLNSAVEIVQAQAKGDNCAAQTLQWHIHYLAVAVANLINIIGPQQVVIVNHFINELDTYVLALQQQVSTMAQPAALEKVQINCAKFGVQAGSIGAATLAFIE